jgi:hypothetical protein
MPPMLKSWLSKKLGDDQAPKSKQPPSAARKSVASYHSVAIRPGQACCEGAKQLAGIRFLSSTAPKLPLPHCNAGECRCRYAHFQDRRSPDDRRGLKGWHKPKDTDLSKRQNAHGRRKGDTIE